MAWKLEELEWQVQQNHQRKLLSAHYGGMMIPWKKWFKRNRNKSGTKTADKKEEAAAATTAPPKTPNPVEVRKQREEELFCERIQIMVDLCKALEYLHERRIMHRGTF